MLMYTIIISISQTSDNRFMAVMRHQNETGTLASGMGDSETEAVLNAAKQLHGEA